MEKRFDFDLDCDQDLHLHLYLHFNLVFGIWYSVHFDFNFDCNLIEFILPQIMAIVSFIQLIHRTRSMICSYYFKSHEPVIFLQYLIITGTKRAATIKNTRQSSGKKFGQTFKANRSESKTKILPKFPLSQIIYLAKQKLILEYF